MSDIGLVVPESQRVWPAPGCPDPVSLPPFQSSPLNSPQIVTVAAIQAPPPTPLSHSP